MKSVRSSFIARDNKLVLWLGIFFAMIFISIGVIVLFNHRKMISRCSEATEGVVVGFIREYNNKGSRPVVEYIINGQSVKLQSTTKKRFTLLKAGDAITIHYNLQDGEMWIEGYDNNLAPYLLAVMSIFSGFMMGLLAILRFVIKADGTVLRPMAMVFAVGDILGVVVVLISAIMVL